MANNNKSYQRRSGVVIRDTIADEVLLDIVDSNTESIRDLALVAAYISKASPKFFGYIKTEMFLSKPNVDTLIKTFNFAHDCVQNQFIVTPENTLEPSKISIGQVVNSPIVNESPVIRKNDLNVSEDVSGPIEIKASSHDTNTDIMPMMVQDMPLNRRGIKITKTF
jgi:hypothetical protein